MIEKKSGEALTGDSVNPKGSKNLTRRSFLKTTTIAGAGLGRRATYLDQARLGFRAAETRRHDRYVKRLRISSTNRILTP